MKNFIIIILLSLLLIGCQSAVEPPKADEMVSAHGENSNMPTTVPPTSAKSKWTQGGDPIDVSTFNAEIEKAEKNLKAKPNDETAKTAASDAYFKRGFALTEARQYASALGDYRRAAKLNPKNAEADEWIKKIVAIYNGLNKSYPNEGEEPPPLPFGKDADKTSTTDEKSSGDERIKFDKGAVDATAKGNLKDYDDSKTFVIEVNAGQTLKTEQIKAENSLHHVTVNITDPTGRGVGDSDLSCNNRKEIAPTVAGDYKIKVYECKKADEWNDNFDLKVSVK